MKTTVEIDDDLLARAATFAAAEGTTVRALIEIGLRQVLSGRIRTARRFVLRDAAVKGRGTVRGIREGTWFRIRDRIYEGRGA